MNMASSFAAQRNAMVDRQVKARGIHNNALLSAMREVPRERFVHRFMRAEAYADNPLPIGYGQTISQPYIVALMTDALQLSGNERLLEIGTGSGYAAAVLSLLCREVFTVECIEPLARRARRTLASLGYDNVRVRTGDGTLGWPEKAPFDGIVVTAGGPVVPEALKAQLTRGGRLVIPVGDDLMGQQLLRVTRLEHDKFKTENLGGVRFVPLIGEQGWDHEQLGSSYLGGRRDPSIRGW